MSSVGLSRSAIFCSAARIARAEAIAREPVWGTGGRGGGGWSAAAEESGRGEAREQSREAPLCCALLVASTQNEMTSFASSGVNTKPAPLFAHRVSLCACVCRSSVPSSPVSRPPIPRWSSPSYDSTTRWKQSSSLRPGMSQKHFVFEQNKTTLSQGLRLTHHLGPGALFIKTTYTEIGAWRTQPPLPLLPVS